MWKTAAGLTFGLLALVPALARYGKARWTARSRDLAGRLRADYKPRAIGVVDLRELEIDIAYSPAR